MKTSLHKKMKTFFLLGTLIIMAMILPQHNTYAQQKNVGINNATPDASAALDVKSGASINQGILIPFVDLATATFPSPGPANGLLVHNSNAAYGQGTGVYQNIGTAAAPIWLKQITRNDAWYLFGNRITSAGAPATYGTSKIPSGNWIGTANTTDLTFGTDSTERARLFSSGQFSIGSSSVGAKFEVHQVTGTDVARFVTYGNTNDIALRRTQGTQASPTATSGAGTVLGRLFGQGYNGSSFTTAASISLETDNVSTGGGASDMPGSIVFNTTPDGTGATTEKMRIRENGTVGIGTSTPAEKLEVNKGNIKITPTSTATSTEGQLQFSAGGINTTTKMVVVRKTISVTTSNTTPSANVFDDGYMRFGVYYNSTSTRWTLSMSPYNNQYYDYNYLGNERYYNGTYYYTSSALNNYVWALSDDVTTTSGTYYEIAGVTRNTGNTDYGTGGSGTVYAEGTGTTNPFYEFTWMTSYTSTTTQRLITVIIKAYY